MINLFKKERIFSCKKCYQHCYTKYWNLNLKKGSWRGKMQEIGIALGKSDSSHWDWDLVIGNGEKMSKIDNGNGIWALRSGIWKTKELGNGIWFSLSCPSGPSINIYKIYKLCWGYIVNLFIMLIEFFWTMILFFITA